MKQNKCGKDNKKLEPLFTVGAMYSYYGKQMVAPQTIKNVILLLGVNQKESKEKSQREICVFTAALVTIAKMWKQPKCPQINE